MKLNESKNREAVSEPIDRGILNDIRGIENDMSGPRNDNRIGNKIKNKVDYNRSLNNSSTVIETALEIP